MKKVRLVAKAALVNEKGQILILTRSKTDKTRPGELDFPGGRVEEQENYEEAVIREIEEEIGVKLTKDEMTLVYTDTSFYEDKTTIRFLFAGMIKRAPEIVLSYEHSDSAWMNMKEVEEKFSHPVWVDGLKFAASHDLLPVTINPS